MDQHNITPEEFVQVWQSSSSAQEVAKKLGQRVGTVTARASFYRRKGVSLKKFNNGRIPRNDWERLAKLARDE